MNADLALTCTPSPGTTTLTVKADAHMVREPLVLIVRTASLAATAEGAGRAIASLFTGDRQKVSWAWASMWQRAEAGLATAGVLLSQQGGAEDTGTARLLRLKGQASDRRGRGAKTTGKLSTAGGGRPLGKVDVRRLKDISELEPDEGTLVNEGRSKPGIAFPTPVSLTRPEPSGGKNAGPSDGGPTGEAGGGARASVDGGTMRGAITTGPPKRRTVLPPATEREQLAFDAVQRALALNPPEIEDLRARRGIGADAMDDLRQLYEIKMSAGEPGNEVTLLKSQAEAAQDPDFFLALVGGLEDGDVPLSVRFIFDPLRRLSQRITGDVTLTGLREVEALEYRFRKPGGSPADG